MNLHQVAPVNSLTDFDQIPAGYLERIASELAQEACEPVDRHNIIVRILLMIHQANEEVRDWIIAVLVRLIYIQSDEFDIAFGPHLSKLVKEVKPTKCTRKGPKP